MAITYTILARHGAILARATGTLALQTLLDYLTALVADPLVPEPHVTLLDASGVHHLELTPEDVDAVSAFTVAHGSKVAARKLALVVRGDAQAELAERYRELAEKFQENTLVFFNRDVAFTWLGLPADAERQMAREVPGELGNTGGIV